RDRDRGGAASDPNDDAAHPIQDARDRGATYARAAALAAPLGADDRDPVARPDRVPGGLRAAVQSGAFGHADLGVLRRLGPAPAEARGVSGLARGGCRRSGG